MSKMRILCLHGTHTSGEIFKVQLGQLVTRLEVEQNLELCFIDGLIETECHRDLRGIFPGPYYTWCSVSSDHTLVDFDSAKQALDFVGEIIEEEGPFDGIMGFSQGATLALAFLLRHAKDHPLDPPYAICKFAIFFSCVEMKDKQNHWEGKLSIPSLHIFDKADSLSATSTLAVEHCVLGSAKLLLHQRGHVIPRDNVTVNAILSAVQDLQYRAMIF